MGVGQFKIGVIIQARLGSSRLPNKVILPLPVGSKKTIISEIIWSVKDLSEISKHISSTERKAVSAERESTKFFQTIFLLDSIGQVYNGTITGVADHGMYVRMDDNYCEGMVSLSEIPGDRYVFDQDKFCIVGVNTKKEFSFGESVRVKIDDVNPKKRQIDLELVNYGTSWEK